jgi:hypothetical protein
MTITPEAGALNAPATGRPHGYARYKLDGCRCYTCCFAVSEYNAARDRAIAYGTWQPWTDAAPVREHLLRLRECGLGTRRVAELADIDRKRLQAILTGRPERGTGPQAKCRPALTIAVLAIEPTLDNLAPSALISSVGTLRRLQALIAIGWPQAQLAARLGQTAANFSALMRRNTVTVRLTRAVRRLYDALWDADPLAHGVTAQAVSRARNAAAAAGWPPPAAWDDELIDDPTARTPRCAGRIGGAA